MNHTFLITDRYTKVKIYLNLMAKNQTDARHGRETDLFIAQMREFYETKERRTRKNKNPDSK